MNIAVDLPKRAARATLTELTNPQPPTIASEEDLELLLSGLRAAGRARVGYPQQHTDDVLEAVLTRLRRL